MEAAIKSIEVAVTEAVQQTFADMAFIDVEVDSESDFPGGQMIHISFYEPVEGEMALMLSKACKESVVENIYGKDWSEVDSAAVDDCLLEMINVIAGNFLNLYCGFRSKHNLSLPKLIFDLDEVHNRNEARFFCFDAEGAPLKIVIHAKEKPEA